MTYNCALHIATKEVDGEVIELCYGTVIGHRGMCKKCYDRLVEEGLIRDGDFFESFPLWLQEMIRFEDKEDHYLVRHLTENLTEMQESSILGNNRGLKVTQMLSSV